ncbi:MAG TPA: phage portal protein [Pseudonocardia sp.]
MPLPPNNTAWPPVQLAAISPSLATWSAWYTGDPDALHKAYSSDASAARERPSQRANGVVGRLSRWFWGQPTNDPSQPKQRLHVPIAADLCQTSADLLFADPPTFTHPNTAAQERLEAYADDGLLTSLAEASEVAAAMTGVYLRVTWDKDARPDGPFLTRVDADAAEPTFRWGQLVGVTFWRVVAENDSTVWRHLERHELESGVGVIRHGLYEGTPTNLGRMVPLTEQAATAHLADLVDVESTISTDSPGLAVVYVPNQRPQRKWRSHPVGAHLGRSDLDGVESFMDALDETYTSWMRDIRLAKSRVFIARYLIENNGPGQGGMWDADREVYTALDAIPNHDAAELPIKPQQFAIRVDEHRDTANELVEVILRSAGYSTQTFGEGVEGGAPTATEIRARERRSYLTRDRKIRLVKPELRRILAKLLAVDAAIFHHGNVPTEPVGVEFPDGVQEDPQTAANTAELLRRADAASTETLVALVHPDWDDTQIGAEAAKIHAERAVPDPAGFRPGVDDTPPADVEEVEGAGVAG